MLKPYFEKKLAEVIRTTKKTGVNKMGDVFARRYSFEVLWVSDEEVCLKMDSIDLVPAGYTYGGTEKTFGEVVLTIKDEISLEFILDNIIREKDSAFIEKYFSVAK